MGNFHVKLLPNRQADSYYIGNSQQLLMFVRNDAAARHVNLSDDCRWRQVPAGFHPIYTEVYVTVDRQHLLI